MGIYSTYKHYHYKEQMLSLEQQKIDLERRRVETEEKKQQSQA
ncbi:hypothetical protein ACFFGV_00865 [Pontibacillus salicampi]|uniref:Uncharacterized protein n=1 Tax=Pontibacillus salicampi TaxID=1449801 RepID=A0ABV6LIB0_9BACI